MERQKGFTLVEAAVAIGIVAILSGIIIPLVMKNLNDARIARAKNDINVIVAAIVSQQKDIGSRPMAAGPGTSTGAGDAVWFSTNRIPTLTVGGAPLPAPAADGNTFASLFSSQAFTVRINALFGLAGVLPGAEHAYKGPYLSADVAGKSDPWGKAYVILGYNHDGQTSGGPIWVVSAGESGTITDANTAMDRPAGAPAGTPVQHNAVWNYAGLSATNIAVRAN